MRREIFVARGDALVESPRMFSHRLQQSVRDFGTQSTKFVLLIVCLALCAAWATGQTPAPEAVGNFSGKVVETMNAGNYTYVLVQAGKKKLWAAAPQFQVKVGDTVAISGAMAMPNFHSRVLNRDFDLVYFTGSVQVNGAPAVAPVAKAVEMPKGHPPISGAAGKPTNLPKGHPPIAGASAKPTDLPKGHPSIRGAEAQPAVKISGIMKADGGKTVAEIYAARAELKGKTVKVRGKVVKFNPEIMRTNWLHIQDGTGGADSNDLTVTTVSKAKVGDTVLITGTVATDRDFGSGYKYSVIVEDAKVEVE